ncbi:putative glycoside hydrolase, partial [Staphylococcus aureus]
FHAPGYRQTSMARTDLEHAGGVVRLEPFLPKALYLTVYGVGSEKLLGRALSIIKGGGANALVIDLKGDRGIVPYPSAVALTATPGVRK